MLVSAFIFVGCTPNTNNADENNTNNSTSNASVSEGAEITAEMVAEHNSSEDCWTIIDGKVYNLTSYINNHPGGAVNISQICGIDGTDLFTGNPSHDQRANNELEALYIGDLAN